MPSATLVGMGPGATGGTTRSALEEARAFVARQR